MYAENIVKQVRENTNFRKVLYTGAHCQIVAMNLQAGEDIGLEVHNDIDQMFYFVEGSCEAVVGGDVRAVHENDVVFVPAGTQHNFKNTGAGNLLLFTVYAPPQHPDGTVHATKKDAQKHETDH